MIINIGEIEKVGITHAIRVAIGRINSSLATAFSTCHPDRHNMDWYRRVEDDISVMKELKQLLDRIERRSEGMIEMKNIEKYTNTKDALEAYNGLGLKRFPFEEWLEREFEEPHVQTLLEAAEAVIDEWYYTQQNVTLNDIGEKIVDLKNAIARENCKPFRNCDKYMTANDALSSFMQMCKERECITCPFEYGRKYPFSCHFNWLYEDSRFKWVHAEDRKEA